MTIPTQIFDDAHGTELSRHEGFISKEDILAKWNELGIDLQPKATSTL
jgi:thioredoxin 1